MDPDISLGRLLQYASDIFQLQRSIYLGQSWMGTLILTRFLVSMGLSTNQRKIYCFAGYLRLALIFKLRQSWQKQSS